MEKDEIKYLSYKDVRKIIDTNELHYLMLLGQRSNGKSFASKEMALRDAWENDSEFTYLRRRKEDIQDYMIIEYFADMLVKNKKGRNKIEEITNGECNGIAVYKKGIYFSKVDTEGNEKRFKQCGYAHALSGLEGLKSRQFPKVKYTLFEEFIATSLYLWNESDKMQNYASTVFRHRQGCVIMIGNTISRIVPYFTDWQLDNVPRQKQGTIDIYRMHTGDTETRIGVFMCTSIQYNTGMFFGTSAKMIVNGEWDREEQPKLEHYIEEYETLYNVVFQFSESAVYLMSFIRLKSDTSIMLWYIEPKTTPIKENTRVVSPKFYESRLYSPDFIPLNAKEKVLFDYLLKDKKVAFSDNLTGTEFNRCLEKLHK